MVIAFAAFIRILLIKNFQFNRDDILGICEECNNDRGEGREGSGGEILLSRHN